jgi:hypothetical protein
LEFAPAWPEYYTIDRTYSFTRSICIEFSWCLGEFLSITRGATAHDIGGVVAAPFVEGEDVVEAALQWLELDLAVGAARVVAHDDG